MATADDLEDGLEYTFDSDAGASDTGDDDLAVAVEQEAESAEPANAPVHKPEKSEKRKRQKEKMAEKKRRRMETEVSVKKALAGMEPAMIADYLARKARLWNPKLSAIELDDAYVVSQSSIADLSGFDKPRSLENFGAFLEKVHPKLTDPDQTGSPFVVVIAISAIRVCDVRRAIPKTTKAMKIIAKNNIATDCKNLQTAKPSVVLSTPERLKTILDKQSLKLDNLTTVIVDCSFLDPKARSVLDDVPETLAVLKRLSLGAPKARIALF